MKKRRFLIILAALMLTLALAGCRSSEVVLESLLPRQNVTEASVSFLNAGIGQNIPRVGYAAGEEGCTQLCDLLYGASPVVVDIPVNYSPEINASHEIFLTTAEGTMSLYYDDYQNLINLPINRRINEETVRVYLSFQVAGINDLLTDWQAELPAAVEPEPIETPAQTPSFPPDDTALRAAIDASLFSLTSTEIAFEPAVYPREYDGALYYAFTSADKAELATGKVLVVAAPDRTESVQLSISGIAENDYYILITVASAPADADSDPAAVLCDLENISKGKTLVFLDAEQNLLYAQTLTVPQETEAPAEPDVTEPAEPSGAAGGEVGTDEPLQP